jgi:hypothetical protein
MSPPEPLAEPGLDQARRAETLMRAHTDLVARFGLGVAPTFKQTLNRVIAVMDAEAALSDRPVDGVTSTPKSGL